MTSDPNPHHQKDSDPGLEPDDSASLSTTKTAVLLGTGYLLWRGFVLLLGSGGPLWGLTGSQLDALRAGFEEVSDDWDTWKSTAAGLPRVEVQEWGARAAVLYATEEETLEFFQHRVGFFRNAAANPVLHSLCVSGTLGNGRAANRAMATAVTDRVAQLAGRTYARESIGAAPWRPTLDIADDDQAWDDFLALLQARDMVHMMETLLEVSDRASVDPSHVCLVLSDLYRLAAEMPDHSISHATLAEVVRTFGHAGLELEE